MLHTVAVEHDAHHFTGVAHELLASVIPSRRASYDENLETVGKVSEGFGLLESDLAHLIADRMLFDLEMGSKVR